MKILIEIRDKRHCLWIRSLDPAITLPEKYLNRLILSHKLVDKNRAYLILYMYIILLSLLSRNNRAEKIKLSTIRFNLISK